MVRLERLREVQERRTLSQRELAECSSVCPATIDRLEPFATDPRPSTVRRLTAALRVKPEALMAAPGKAAEPNQRAQQECPCAAGAVGGVADYCEGVTYMAAVAAVMTGPLLRANEAKAPTDGAQAPVESKRRGSKRGYGEGSISQHKTGRWRGHVMAGYLANGKPDVHEVYSASRDE